MGRHDEETQHEVEIAQPFLLEVYAVTQAQYKQVTGMTPSFFSPKGDARDNVSGLNTDDFPVESVSWDKALDFCRVVSMLPPVWNRVARGGFWIVSGKDCRAARRLAIEPGARGSGLGFRVVVRVRANAS